MKGLAVRAVMSSPVISVPPHMPLRKLRLLMFEHKIRRLPVVRNGSLVGIISLGDLRNAFPPDVMSCQDTQRAYPVDQITAEEIMRTNLITIDAAAPLVEAARLMLEHKISGLPVVEAGRLVGMLTESDMFRAIIRRDVEVIAPVVRQPEDGRRDRPVVMSWN